MIEIIVPQLAESVTEGTIAAWLKQPGDRVNAGDYIVELETDKVNVEINAETSGILKEVLKQPGDTVEVGEVIAYIVEGVEAAATPAPQAEAKVEKVVEAKEEQPVVEEDTKGERTLAFPSARKLAREKGINLNEVATNDPLGRVRKQDVAAYQNAPAPTPAPAAKPAPEAPKASAGSFAKPTERIKMSRRRQTIAKRLVEAQQTAAMLTTYNEVDMSALLDLRKRRKDQFFDQNGVKLGFMSFFTKAVIIALKKFPLVNAEIQGDEIVLKKFYDIGVAVSTDEGLVVPVVRDADRLGFAEIEREIGDLAKKARDNKLKLDDLQGGTFTITNGGVFGSLWSTPILNAPQVGILGMHKIQMRPVAIDDERFENRPMMYLALSYDHRIIDGKEAVGFLVKVKELLEDPESLFLG
ncbi:2-oxoglutarate dehydrogenase complex dihydrolipoyllysine-residue succinyltransferase [Anaerobacillus alkaliphilus]|uniref:Dihydrolipoyllysine-residue succinyltransferase component of 2-oxoglutarate dehydrogenase complex n=1 Tax=Anaerobacillus alkaliphilus TaxID=1548597 RepID=A0A4Q0VRU9_9BACI|nr:2-oxoglutarate dehydrogenase complex dihydrolipoyllysine-residue succinyltransferase [Anaerobacillus alkaliphilus]RXJ00320.1 2-oxoglutarate dehydrogenase complex dihydrolipoyllysine-residue succinyltransferase [Anaerobacillus alkaliphilus]